MPENDMYMKKENEINIKKLLLALFRNLHWMALVALVFGAAFWYYSVRIMKPMYTSNATVYTHNTNVGTSGGQQGTVAYTELYAAEHLLGPYTAILTSDNLLNKTIQSLDLKLSANALRKGLTVSTSDKLVINVSLTRPDPKEAQMILSRLLKFYPSEIDRVIHSGGSEIIDEASLPTSPSSPNVMRNTLFGALVGLLLSAAFFLVMALTNDMITGEEEVLNDFGIPILGVVPQIVEEGKETRKNEKTEKQK